jgi:protein associated with RNAse G/E
MKPMPEITIIKLNATGKEVWRYNGQVIVRNSDKVVLSARFNKDDFLFNGMMLKRDDLFYEAYFRKKWYNIIEIYDRDDDRLKGWYCNVTAPANFQRWNISYRDLALDLLVFPDGRQIVLDEDEFADEDIPPEERLQALSALEELKQIFTVPAGFNLQRDAVVRHFRA